MGVRVLHDSNYLNFSGMTFGAKGSFTVSSRDESVRTALSIPIHTNSYYSGMDQCLNHRGSLCHPHSPNCKPHVSTIGFN